MKLFLANGFVLDEKYPQYRDDVLEFGDVARCGYFRFLASTTSNPTEHKMSSRPCASCTKMFNLTNTSNDTDNFKPPGAL